MFKFVSIVRYILKFLCINKCGIFLNVNLREFVGYKSMVGLINCEEVIKNKGVRKIFLLMVRCLRCVVV